MEKLVSQEIIAQIKELDLPGMVFHEDHSDTLDHLIRMQLCEMFLACSRHCATNTVCERLVQLPSKKVRHTLAIPKFSQKAIEFLKGTPDGGIYCQLTWPTLPSRLHRIAETSPCFLPHKLHPEPPKGGFVTRNRNMKWVGEKLGGRQDSMSISPRVRELDVVTEKLEPLLKKADWSNDKNKTAIRHAFNLIQGENYSHYVRPTSDELSQGARQVLGAYLRTLPTNFGILIERCTVDALEKESPSGSKAL